MIRISLPSRPMETVCALFDNEAPQSQKLVRQWLT